MSRWPRASSVPEGRGARARSAPTLSMRLDDAGPDRQLHLAVDEALAVEDAVGADDEVTAHAAMIVARRPLG